MYINSTDLWADYFRIILEKKITLSFGNIDEAIYQMKIALQKDFSYLTTIKIDMIKDHIESLYDIRDKNKEVKENG